MTMINTQNGIRINTEAIRYFRMEEFADGSMVVRANGNGKGGNFFDRRISKRMSREEAFAYAKEVNADAMIVVWGFHRVYKRMAWVDVSTNDTPNYQKG